jgi:exopolysaccharide biosynthesis polyprenyl glycosylphosphotransferase
MPGNIFRRNLIVPFIKLLIDAATIETSIIFSFWLRFYSPLVRIVPVSKSIPPFINYFYFSVFLIIVFVFLFIVSGSYRTRFYHSLAQDIPVVLKVSFLAILFAMSGAFLYRDFSYSRAVFMLIFFNSILFISAGRLIYHLLKRIFIKRGYDISRACLIGSPEVLKKVSRQLQFGKQHHFQVQGYVAAGPDPELNLKYFGPLGTLRGFLRAGHFDSLILAFNQAESSQTLQVINETEGMNIDLFYLPDVLDMVTASLNTFETNGLLLLQLKSFTLSGWQGFSKFIFDLTVSVAALIILSPLLLFIALLVKLTSPGPVFFRQKRTGLDGREFDMTKFRTMYRDAEAKTGPVWATAGDPRITLLGRFLRRTSLDELPQLFNVIRGEMSLVGPRPERPHFVRQFQNFIPKYSERHRVRSGITGWAQVNGLRGQSPIEERTKYDIYYIENWSLWFDLKIIILTFIAIVKGDNAY